MALSMRGSGRMGRHLERESFTMQMEIYMRATGLIIKLMDLAFTLILKEQDMRVIGRTTNNMGKVLKSGKKEVSMKESIVWEGNRDMVNMYGKMALIMREIGLTIGLMGMAPTSGKMVENTMANGKIMTWKVSVSTYGMTEDAMKVNTITIKNMDSVYTTGQMVENMRDGGPKGNRMA